MKKFLIGFLVGSAFGALLVMVFMHREAIFAALKGGEMPEAPDSCPFSKDK